LTPTYSSPYVYYSSTYLLSLFVSTSFLSFYCSLDHRDLHSFPTRRSSDLEELILPVAGSLSLTLDAFPTTTTVTVDPDIDRDVLDRKSTRLNSSHVSISYAVFCLKKKKEMNEQSKHKQENNDSQRLPTDYV